ncbi:MAG: SSU ribosomal protein S1p [Anaerolineae bacterium]|jgi:small subunit ribosomal protein S1|nr:MAG: SSU ribosomal protein S1p [Anaerolineae bacterium]
MVTEARRITTQDEPPPLDEGWWQAVLAEDSFIPDKASFAGEKPKATNPGTRSISQESVNWELAKALYHEDRVVDLQVTGYNKGGLLVSGSQLQGFVPISHLIDMPNNLTPEEQEQCLAAYQGHTLRLKVIECDPQRGRVVFSERAAQADSGRRNLIFSQLKAGECVQGTVTNITDFGVFVDLGGVEGLIHVSELSWGRVRHPSDVVKLGEKVYVYVIQVDPQRSRIALSLKRLCQNPWETAEERYYPGQITEAVITSIVPFGAFARLEEGLDGLIHITEFGALKEGQNQLQSLREGDRVKVRVLHVDASKQRLGLSLQLQP